MTENDHCHKVMSTEEDLDKKTERSSYSFKSGMSTRYGENYNKEL